MVITFQNQNYFILFDIVFQYLEPKIIKFLTKSNSYIFNGSAGCLQSTICSPVSYESIRPKYTPAEWPWVRCQTSARYCSQADVVHTGYTLNFSTSVTG